LNKPVTISMAFPGHLIAASRTKQAACRFGFGLHTAASSYFTA
jgi:hypothetical protein